MRKTVSIVIPTWNGKHLLQKYLPSVLAAQTEEVDEIVLVDDCSTDGTSAWVQKKFSDIKLVFLPRHSGFAHAVNSGVRVSRGDIVVLLNNDVSPKKDFLCPLIAHFQDRRVFAVTCLEENKRDSETVRRGRGEGAFRHGLLVHWAGRIDKPYSLWATGGNAAFDRRKWNELGGMDTMYAPFYWEDIDLSYRAWKRGWVVRFEPKSVVEHVHESTIGKHFRRTFVQQIDYRNRWLFAWKNFTDLSLFIQLDFWFVYHFGRAILTRNWPMLLGMGRAVGRSPQALLHRRWSSEVSDSDVIGLHQRANYLKK